MNAKPYSGPKFPAEYWTAWNRLNEVAELTSELVARVETGHLQTTGELMTADQMRAIPELAALEAEIKHLGDTCRRIRKDCKAVAQ